MFILITQSGMLQLYFSCSNNFNTNIKSENYTARFEIYISETYLKFKSL